MLTSELGRLRLGGGEGFLLAGVHAGTLWRERAASAFAAGPPAPRQAEQRLDRKRAFPQGGQPRGVLKGGGALSSPASVSAGPKRDAQPRGPLGGFPPLQTRAARASFGIAGCPTRARPRSPRWRGGS